MSLQGAPLDYPTNLNPNSNQGNNPLDGNNPLEGNYSIAFSTTPPANRKICKTCPNIANPWHECTTYCVQKHGRGQSVQQGQKQMVNPLNFEQQYSQMYQTPQQNRQQPPQQMSNQYQTYQSQHYRQQNNQFDPYTAQLLSMGYSYQDIQNQQQ